MEGTNSLNSSDFKKLLAEDRLQQLIDALSQHTEEIENSDLYNRVLIQAGKFKRTQEQRLMATVDYDDITRTQNNIRVGLLDIINELSRGDELGRQEQKEWGVSEQSIKKEVFWFLAIGKLLVVWFAFFLYSTGTGFTYQGFLLVLGIIIPTLAAYLGLIYEDILSKRQEHQYKDFRVNKLVRSSSRFFFALYFIMLVSALYLQGLGIIPDTGAEEGKPNYENLTSLLALLESFVGGYLALLVKKLFQG